MTALRLDSLTLTHFRCFPRCEVAFHPAMTVLVAENGGGKTAVLEAAADALSVFVNAIYPSERVLRIERADVRLSPGQERKMSPCLPTKYEAKGTVKDEAVTWTSAVRTYGNRVRPSTVHLGVLKEAAQPFLSDTAVLPLVAFYGTGRLWSEQRQTEYRRSSVTNVRERVSGYTDCLTSTSSFKGISTWFEHRAQQIASPAFKESLSTNLAMIAGVKQAANTVLKPTGWSNLDWDPDLDTLTAEHEVLGRLPLSMLSDGIRTMLALVADVARRCASLNPQLSDQAPANTQGVLIVDEVDMHLHPRWQQQVLGLLGEAFPELQIIVSTHSPHVLSTVDKSSIRVLRLEGGQATVLTPQMQTRGVESADVLASVMDVDPVPQLPEAKDLNDYRALIQSGKHESNLGRGLHARLVAHFGQEHPLLLELDALKRLQDFRRASKVPPTKGV